MSEERFLGIRMFTWNGLGGLSAVVGLVGLVLAGTLGVIEYLDRKTMARASETLNMIEIWELRGAQNAYLSISQALEPLLLAQRDNIEANPERAKTIKLNIARRALARAEPGAYETVIHYFTRLSLCVRTEICSIDVAQVFFLDTIVDFRDWFGGEIERRRDLDMRHALEIDWLICEMSKSDPSQASNVMRSLCAPDGTSNK